MSRLGRRVSALLGAVAALLVGVVGPAFAGGLQDCMDKAINHNGEPPTCTKVNGEWVPSWPSDSGPGGGVPSGFGVLIFLMILVGIGITVWKVSTARNLAKQSGMDPNLATQMTLLSDDGLDATYLASSLRQPQAAPAAPAAPQASATERLTELTSLLNQGLITQAEYDERRKAIIDAV